MEQGSHIKETEMTADDGLVPGGFTEDLLRRYLYLKPSYLHRIPPEE